MALTDLSQGAFLLLHVWREQFNSRPEQMSAERIPAHSTLALLQSRTGGAPDPTQAVKAPTSLALSCARVICDRFVTGELRVQSGCLALIVRLSAVQPIYRILKATSPLFTLSNRCFSPARSSWRSSSPSRNPARKTHCKACLP